MIKVNQPMDLEGARNVRELGGYPTEDGHVTKKGVFLRADGTHALTNEDIAKLRQAGVGLVVDMRSPDEVKQMPSRLAGLAGIQYENVVMFDGLQSSLFRDAMPKSMAELYCRLLDSCQLKYRYMFHLFSVNKTVSLFHCTAGKDRTGVVAMLLLQLAGVPDSVIIADYAVSEKNMAGLFDEQHKRLEEKGVKIPSFVFGSRAEDMEKTLQHLQKRYGGAEPYLRECGVSGDDLVLLKDKLIL